ncbi:NADH dehydrogenase (ubiquinone) complex I, assembly factor 6-like [Olea europaea subsp. europaea]|uniref:NADH dehydrogenase (Ubiquinone) complex I, assembly factor 6-like n=1 Tax=Olea europaea subsp. europaea TaxID=158383 RepID=A0A8S0U6H8_OLEEU|nr:NADH dehydrogenase (ubiquinone) complex I, assembly factor 6-like [Olea europaea subsp. europaea]
MRKPAFALRTFNVETSRAMDVASDPKIGLMRLLWWKETIDKIFSNSLIEHPVTRALGYAISEHKLERYAEDTASTILYSMLQSSGIRSTIADHAASHIGKASGLLLLLKSLSYHTSKNRHFSYIPTEVTGKHGLLVNHGGQREIRVDSHESLCNTIFEMVAIAVANDLLQKSQKLRGTIPTEARSVLQSVVLTKVILDTLRRF